MILKGVYRIAAVFLLLFSLGFFSSALCEYTTLRKGDSGPEVAAMKQRMYELGYFTSTKFSSSFNDTTQKRVKLLQRMNGLEETGTADPALLELLFSDQVIAANGQSAYELAASITPVASATPKPTKAPKSTKTPKPTKTPRPTKTPKTTKTPQPLISPINSPVLPARDEDGFLSDEEYLDTEFVHKDPDDGLWIYLSKTLQVEIRRYNDPNGPLVWYETEVKTKDGERMGTPHIANIARGKLFHGETIAKENHAVLAISDDFYFYRVRNTKYPGVIVRNGEILYDKAKIKGTGGFPKQEVLAYFQDGSMKCFDVGQYTAEEYLQMGATDVFSFGPILVTNGQAGEQMSNPKYYHYREPRCALGMIEPGHYIILTVKGRSDDSRGCYFSFLADRMLSLGVQEALNLDGGGTASLIFMGEQLNYKGTASRTVASLITFGTSDLVQPDPE